MNVFVSLSGIGRCVKTNKELTGQKYPEEQNVTTDKKVRSPKLLLFNNNLKAFYAREKKMTRFGVHTQSMKNELSFSKERGPHEGDG